MVRIKDKDPKPCQGENEALNISELKFNTEYEDERQKMLLLAVLLFPYPLVYSVL